MSEPRVGVGVLVWYDDKVLLGRRRGAHGAETFCFPGGHLEFGESWQACAEREVREETGLELHSIRVAAVTNDVFAEEGKHYITIFMQARARSNDAELREPDKCDGWAWFAWSELPSPLFLPIRNLLASGYVPVPPAGSRR
jgi:8-oxo-dGTP diphosphatase